MCSDAPRLAVAKRREMYESRANYKCGNNILRDIVFLYSTPTSFIRSVTQWRGYSTVAVPNATSRDAGRGINDHPSRGQEKGSS